MSQKMQQLLDLIVNEEMDKANELFHEIVVEKSREIYENLIAEESEDEEVDEAQHDDEEVDESAKSDDEEVDEAQHDDDEEVDENYMMGDETTMEIGGDAGDDMVSAVSDKSAMGDMGGDEMGGDMDGDMGGDMNAPADKGDIQDLEDALAELKAEFEALVGGGMDDTPEMGDDEEDAGEEEFGDEEDDSEEDDEETAETMGFVREYRETVKKPGNSEPSGTNTKSVGLQNPKRVDSPANSKNIAQSATGSDPKPGVGGLVKKGGDFVKSGTQNVGGNKAKGYSDKVAQGHGAEKKGSGESNVNTKDILPK